MSIDDDQHFDRAGLLRRGVAAARSFGARAACCPQLASAKSRADAQSRRLFDAEARDGEDHPGCQATPQGQGVSFTQSYGPSTSQAQAVAAGQPADIVFLSGRDDVQIARRRRPRQPELGRAVLQRDRRQHGRRVRRARRQPEAHQGLGRPVKPGVQVITPNPFSSGSAKWNILAAYGAAAAPRQDRQAGDRVRAGSCSSTSSSQRPSGSNATNTFLAGKGDVLITYESEAINGDGSRARTSST